MKRKPGRPPLDPAAPSTRVDFRLSQRQYDALYLLARRARVTISELVRLGLERELRRDFVPPK